jgi:hypothetical protein
MSPDDVRVIFERVCYKMVIAGWLQSYGFTAGVGHQVTWRREGAQKAILLKDLGERFKLTEFDNYPLYFQLACKGIKGAEAIVFPPIPIETSAFWMLCVGELDLEGDGDGLLAMMHIVTSWGPGSSFSSLEDSRLLLG